MKRRKNVEHAIPVPCHMTMPCGALGLRQQGCVPAVTPAFQQ